MSRLKNPIMVLEPSLWETLPNELLHLVFARLPVAGIGQLRVLSKEWKRNVDCKDSEFNRQVFDARAHLNMFGLLSHTFIWDEWVGDDALHIYDMQTDKWHVHEIRNGTEVANFVGADGGLVCCYWECYPKQAGYDEYILLVINPLTNQTEQLPPLRCLHVEIFDDPLTRVKMIKLTMDKKTKDYKVFVVGSIANDGQGFFAQVYNSCTKEWTVVEATQGHIIGWNYSKHDHIFSIYNYANRTLQHFDETNIVQGLKVEQGCCVLIEDHLFVLHKETSLDPANMLEANEGMLPKYCISEFHMPKKSIAWVQLRVHSCGPCNFIYYPPGHIDVQLWGCNGFLFLQDYGSNINWLYNLSTCKWRILPAFRRIHPPLVPSMICTISWSAIA